MTKIYTNKKIKNTRSALRKRMTAPELIFWAAVRGRKVKGYKFRRQYSVGRYVIDFYCTTARIGVEIDGNSHFTKEQKKYDAIRSEYVGALGIKILRYTNEEIMKNLNGVLEDISTRLP